MFDRSKCSEIQSDLDAIQNQLGQIRGQITSPQHSLQASNQRPEQCDDQSQSAEVASAETIASNTLSPMDRLDALLAKTNGAEAAS